MSLSDSFEHRSSAQEFGVIFPTITLTVGLVIVHWLINTATTCDLRYISYCCRRAVTGKTTAQKSSS